MIVVDEAHDGIGKNANIALYENLLKKLKSPPFARMPANQAAVLEKGKGTFLGLTLNEQARLLSNVITLFSGSTATTDLMLIQGKEAVGNKTLSCFLSNWKKNYHDVRILDASPAGLHEKMSGNLLELL